MDVIFNPDKQHTLSSGISTTGRGLHTGVSVNMRLLPGDPDFGYQFRRVDLPGKPLIKADCDLVTNTFRGTTLSCNGASISTVEHILAALVGMSIDNCLIEIDNKEIPIIDGSCAGFVKMIEKAGIEEQQAIKRWYMIDTAILYRNAKKNVEIKASPSAEYKITTFVDFKNPQLGKQSAELNNIKDFKTEIAPCRTYCFLHELEMLFDRKLIQGDIVNNAILMIDKPMSLNQLARLSQKFKLKRFEIVEGKYLNNLELHFDNEIARHKLMDVIGDLALIGYPIKAHIQSSRSGHTTNVEFAKRVKQYIKNRIFVAETIPLNNWTFQQMPHSRYRRHS